MGRLREIPRTAAFAWSSRVTRPLVATGTRAGAVDADFSTKTELEIWSLDSAVAPAADATPIASTPAESRFYDIAWSQPTTEHPEGVIACALENGSLELYNAAKIIDGSGDALIARTNKHSGAIKCLQFNPHRPELLASAGAKGELFITDLNKPEEPDRIGTSAARADDFDSLDWNKKVPHILVTGSSGGFVTVWDVKAKKESLSLNNYNRKPISAVAWNPDEPTKLATAIPTDQDPLILMWNLRNSASPEKVLKGHDQGVLSLSWCGQDNRLLLSCGKDNRNICWNAETGQMMGEFPIVLNHTFQTRWNPVHPGLLATASYDGKITIHSIQNTGSVGNDVSGALAQAADASDFFASAQTAPQASSFNIPVAPKWMKKPVGVSFGFGGKVVTFSSSEAQPKNSAVKLSTFVSDSKVETSISEFQTALKGSDVSQTCESRIESSTTDASKEDWRVIQTLVSDSPRKQILSYLGFEEAAEKSESKEVNGVTAGEKTDDADGGAFFDNPGDSSNFLAELASSKGARTNNPFHIYSGKESEAEKQITKALMLGQFEQAMDICLKENKLSDAFMIAICGGQKCIDKAQAAYFSKQSDGPNFARLLASVVGKNLWDVVYNADMEDWKEVMATLCTFADATEFPDLCEALGDRLEENSTSRKNASFCYLAGSKLEKVVPIWITEMQDDEQSRMKEAGDESAFSIHVQSLQSFIEKVTIFRRATNYVDKGDKQSESDWKLSLLYTKYTEYADVVAAHGHLDLADEYVSLLPDSYASADLAKNRISQAMKKPAAAAAAAAAARGGRQAATMPLAPAAPAAAQPPANAYMPSNPYAAPAPAIHNSYAPPGAAAPAPNAYGQPNNPYAPSGSYAPSGPPLVGGPPPAGSAASPPPKGGPPRAGANGSNWNDLPEGMGTRAPRSGRGTPNPVAINAPFPNQPPGQGGYQAGPPQFGSPTKQSTPLPPPPKMGQGPPRTASPLTGPSSTTTPPRPSSSAQNAYAPTSVAGPAAALASPTANLPQRTASPYQPPPSTGPTSNRYAPTAAAPGMPSAAPPPMGGRPPIAPNPYMQPQAPQNNQFAPQPGSMPPQPAGGPPPPAARGPPPPRAGSGPPPSNAARPPSAPPAAPAKHPPGDRSHIPAPALPIFTTLSSEMARVKARAPANFKREVDDSEKRLGILFDALNNDAVAPPVLAQLADLAAALAARNFDQAAKLHTELLRGGESSPWTVGVKRLIQMSRATPV